MSLRAELESLWHEDRWAGCVILVSALFATLAWGPTTRPMGDSESYRAAGHIITSGWQQITDRTPGYPLLMWLTGSLDSETTALFVVQLVLHLASVLMILIVARRLGLPRSARLVVAILAVSPPMMVKVVYSGSEALTEFLVVVSLYLFLRWLDSRSGAALLAQGAVLGALAWVRPTFQLVWLPMAAIVWLVVAKPSSFRGVRGGRAPLKAASLLAMPAVLMVGSLITFNGAKFDQWGTTPMFGWFLGSKTSSFVEELPHSEPLRDLLVSERDRRLLLGSETDSENYQFGIAHQLAELTGLDGAKLDKRMLDLNLGLIVSHPFEYIAAVNQSLFNLTGMDAEPAASGPGQIGGWVQSALHLVLVGGFALSLLTLPGLALSGHLQRRQIVILGYCISMAAYVVAVSALVESGSPRLRAPTDCLLVLFMVTGWVVLVGLRKPAYRLKE